MTSGRYIGVCRRCRLINIGAGTGTRGTFWRKRSPEEEKSKLVKQKKSSRSNVRGRKLPRGNKSLPLRLGHTDLLPLHLLNWFRLGLHSMLLAGTSAAGGRSLVQRGSIDDFIVRNNWGWHGRKSISKRCWADKHPAIFVRIIVTLVLNGMLA
jgi:hypothetical protein